MDTSQTITALPRLLIRLYQRASSVLPRRCRFYPTCSEYTRQALEAHGLWMGLWKSTLRLLKCHPWHPGGVDPVHF